MTQGEHVGWLAQIAPGIAAVACWATVLLIVWLVFFKLRHARFLALAAGYLFWTVFFGLVFITAGPHPILVRADTMIAIRTAEILGAVCVLLWVALMVRASVTLVKHPI